MKNPSSHGETVDWLARDLAEAHLRVGQAWEELRGRRLFVTGGTGFWGRWLLESFAHANKSLGLNAEAVVLTRNPDAFRHRAPVLSSESCIRLLSGDVCSFPEPAGEFSHIVHAASDLSVADPLSPLGTIDTALRGTRRVLEFARDHGVEKILYASSGAVYGPMVRGRGAVRECAPVSPLVLDKTGAYAESKRLAELVSCIYGREHGIEVKIARGFAFIGPFLALESHLAAASFMRSALKGEPIVIRSHGQTVRSYLYGADLAVWLWTILFKGTSFVPFNVGSDVPVTIQELALTISEACGSASNVVVEGKLDASKEVEVYLPEISKARSELGLDVFTPFFEAVRRSVLSHL